MQEALLAIVFCLVLLVAGAAPHLPFWMLLKGGIGLLVAGFGLGIPTAVVYHVLLYRALDQAAGGVPKGWIWDPIGMHHLVPPLRRRAVVGWAIAGGAGFVLVVLGILLLGAALLAGWSDGR